MSDRILASSWSIVWSSLLNFLLNILDQETVVDVVVGQPLHHLLHPDKLWLIIVQCWLLTWRPGPWCQLTEQEQLLSRSRDHSPHDTVSEYQTSTLTTSPSSEPGQCDVVNFLDFKELVWDRCKLAYSETWLHYRHWQIQLQSWWSETWWPW